MAVAHVDVLGARVVRGPRMALRIRFLGSAAVWREQKKEERWDTEKKEKRKRRKGGRDFRLHTHMRWNCALLISHFVAPYKGLILR